MSHLVLRTSAAALLFAISTVVRADDPNAQAPAASNFGVMTPQQNDQRIVRWLEIDGKAIVECSRNVQDRSTNEQLKQFAQAVVADHDRMHGALKAALGANDQAKPEAGNGAAPEATSVAIVRDDGALRAGKMLFRPTDFVAVKEKVCEKMRDDAKQYFDELSATEFDRTYVVHMTMAHEALLASIDAVEGDASPQLQQALTELKETSQRHLDQFQQWNKQLASTTAERPTATEQK